jgi:hypothetical protein
MRHQECERHFYPVYLTIGALTSVMFDIDRNCDLYQMKAYCTCVLIIALLLCFVAKLVPKMCESNTAANIPVVITVGSTKRAFMCCRIALATLTAASAMLSATFAAFSALRGE